MTLRPALAAILLTATLAACNPPASQGDQSATPDKTVFSIKRDPGSWSMIHTTLAFDAENVGGGMADMVAAGKASVGRKDLGGPLCLSADMAAKDDLTARLNEAIRFGPEWTVVRSDVKDGKVDFAATMVDPEQGKSDMTITGTLTAAATDLTVTTDAWQPAPGKGHIRTVMRQENVRVGDCSPGQVPVQ